MEDFKNHNSSTKKEKKSKLFWKKSRLIKKGFAVIKPPKLVRIKPRGLTRAQRLELLLEKRETERIELQKKRALELKRLNDEKAKEPEVTEFDCSNITFPCQLFVSNLPSKTSKSLLVEHFQELVKLEDIQLPLDKKTKKPRGFGFINISNEDSLKSVMKLRDIKFRDQELTLTVKEGKD